MTVLYLQMGQASTDETTLGIPCEIIRYIFSMGFSEVEFEHDGNSKKKLS